MEQKAEIKKISGPYETLIAAINVHINKTVLGDKKASVADVMATSKKQDKSVDGMYQQDFVERKLMMKPDIIKLISYEKQFKEGMRKHPYDQGNMTGDVFVSPIATAFTKDKLSQARSQADLPQLGELAFVYFDKEGNPCGFSMLYNEKNGHWAIAIIRNGHLGPHQREVNFYSYGEEFEKYSSSPIAAPMNFIEMNDELPHALNSDEVSIQLKSLFNYDGTVNQKEATQIYDTMVNDNITAKKNLKRYKINQSITALDNYTKGCDKEPKKNPITSIFSKEDPPMLRAQAARKFITLLKGDDTEKFTHAERQALGRGPLGNIVQNIVQKYVLPKDNPYKNRKYKPKPKELEVEDFENIEPNSHEIKIQK